MSKDLNKIAKLEKVIKEKYGEDAIKNPKNSWTDEKEQKYLEDLAEFYKKKKKNKKETIQKGGFVLKSKKSLGLADRVCPVCGVYSTTTADDLYFTKYECCKECYIQFVEDREDRWKSGWRPNK